MCIILFSYPYILYIYYIYIIYIFFNFFNFQAVYFTATFPYIILTILFFVGVTLDGADIGLKALFKPDVSLFTLFPFVWISMGKKVFIRL